MRTQTVLKTALLLLAAVLLAVAGACSSDSPTEPERPTPTPPGGGGGGGATAFNVTVTAQPNPVTAGSDDPVLITVRAVRADNGQPAPSGTIATVTALEGSFGEPDGDNVETLTLVNGVAQTTYFPPTDEEGSVVVRANVAGSSGQVTVEVQGTATFFVSHVDPATGSPQGGDTVAIVGNGFDGPVRVLFGGTNATVLSVSPNRIVVRTPVSPGGATATTTVPVTVTVNLNEEEEATDTITGAFTFRPGGGDVQQPAIFSVTPTTGPNEGGTPVSIIGEGFQGPVQVVFCNGGDCVEAAVQSVSNNRIEVRSPPATGFGSVLRDAQATIRITNLDTGLVATQQAAFRYGVQLQVTGLQPDVVNAEDPPLVTIFGSGFESPLQVLVGGIQQQVISVTGTQVVFQPTAVSLPGCGEINQARVVEVRLLNSGATGSAGNLTFRDTNPQPLIQTLNPNSGTSGGGTVVNINGSGFDDPVRVLFGGNQATVQSVTPTQVRVSSPPFTGNFPRQECTTGDGAPGTRAVATSVQVTVTNLDNDCTDTVVGAFVYQPQDTTCVPTDAPPPEDPECDDGIDNDEDGDIDFPDDADCDSANDDDEGA